jgi:hypothetical protein
MDKYADLGYNQYMQRINAPISNAGTTTLAYDFDLSYEVQQRRVITSTLNVNNLVSNSSGGTVSGSFITNSSVRITTTLIPSVPYLTQPTFGVPFIEIYQGTAAVGSLKIYPNYGVGIANKQYSIHAGFDKSSFDGLNSPFTVNVENNTGTTQNIFGVAQWKLLFYNSSKGTT